MTETAAPATRTWNGLAIPAAGTYALDPLHASIGFVAKHMMVSKVRGKFTEASAVLTVGEEPLESGVEVTVRTDSVTTGAGDRDAHLRSGDFFDVENHPELTFRSTGVSAFDGDEFVLSGELTIRGVTKPVELKASFEGVGVNPWGVPVVGFSASTQIDREDWGLTWNAALETGGVLVSKKVTIEIDAEFNPTS